MGMTQPTHMQAENFDGTADPLGRALCAEWMEGAWHPAPNSAMTRDSSRVTCLRCREVLAELVEAKLGGQSHKRLHYESSKRDVLCLRAADSEYRTTRVQGAVTCKRCRAIINRITARNACKHPELDYSRAFMVQAAPTPVALCANCGAVCVFSTCTQCWGGGCEGCGGAGAEIGPRLEQYETTTVKEL